MKQPPKHWYSPVVSWLSETSHAYMLIFVVLFAAAGSILLFSSHAATGLKTPIQGVFDRGSLNNSSYSLPSNSDLAALGGVVANVSWADLEPTQGTIDSAGSGDMVANQLDNALTAVNTYNSNSNHTNKLEVKLRIFAGIYAPPWAKTIDGWTPQTTCNNQGNPCGTIGPFWTTDYDNAFKTFMTDLASAKDSLGNTYDSEPLLHDVTISQCMTTYAEPFQRDDQNLGAILYESGSYAQGHYSGLPYSTANDEQCLTDEVDNATGWKQTHLSLSFNPYKTWTSATNQAGADEAFSASVMAHCRAVLGSQCVIENNSIRDSYIGEQNTSGNLYYDITNKGPDITFQTATLGSVGNLGNTVGWAVTMGANAVELPSGYSSTAESTVQSWDTSLVNNPIGDSSSPSPSISSISPSSGTTSGGTSVSIGLSNFPTGTASVTFGGTTGTGVSRSGNTVTVTTPAHAAGSVTVKVSVGSSSATTSYTYNQPVNQLPDLVAKSLTVNPSSPQVGDQTAFSLSITNSGTASVPSGTPITAAFTIDGTKVTWETDYSSGLAVGASTTLSADAGSSGNGFWTATAGNHTLVGTVNDGQTITESSYSNNNASQTFNVPTPPPPQAPGPPTDITSPSQTTNSISLSWAASVPGTGGDPDSKLTYHILRDGVLKGASQEGDTTYTDSGLNPGQTYSYTIYATDTAGRMSNVSSAFTQATMSLNCPAPAAPSNFKGSASSDGTSATLTWDAVTATAPCAIAYYTISQGGVSIAQPTTTTYTDANLTPATTYTFSVLAVTNDGHAGAASSTQVTTPTIQDNTPPTAPTNLAGQAVSSSQINLTWTAASDPQSGIADYEIIRDGTQVGTATSSDTSFGDTNLDPNTNYNYIVIAVNGVGLTASSTQINVTTLPVTSGNGSGSGTGTGSNGGSGSSVTQSDVSPLLQNTTSVGAGTDAGGSGLSFNPTSSNPVSDNPAAKNTTPGSKAKVAVGLSPAARIVSGIVGVALIVIGIGYALILLRRSQRPHLHPDLSFLHPVIDSGSRLTAGTIIRPNVHHDDQEPKP
jgi:chitodextrinase